MKSILRVLINIAQARKSLPESDQDLYSIEAWEVLWTIAKESPVDNVKHRVGNGTLGLSVDSVNPIELEVHPSIEINTATLNVPPALPLYVIRQHDHRLQAIVTEATKHSSVCVLVGGSSTGKTRACWEAIRSIGKHWRVWHPLAPSRHEALLKALRNRQISPHTILWLNEIQFYLNPSPPELGEEIAAELRELIRDPDRGPVLVIGSCWPEYWDILTVRPGPAKPDLHPQARALLAGHHILVPEEFSEEELWQLNRKASDDQRLEAAAAKGNRRVTQFLAGALELINRYETLPAIARNVIHVMMDVHRFGYKGSISEEFLRDAVQGYVHEDTWAGAKNSWFKKAVKQSRRPCLGVSGPLRLRKEGPNSKATYELADYLDEAGRIIRREEVPPASFWASSAKHLRDVSGLLDLAYEAQIRGRLKYAALVYLKAADCGELEALLSVAEHRRDAGAIDEARKLFRHAADQGLDDAWLYLAQIEKDHGDLGAAARILNEAGDSALAVRIAIYLTDPGQNKGHALRLLERAFELSSKESLADLDLSRYEEELRDLLRQNWESVEEMDKSFGNLRAATENMRTAEKERTEAGDQLIEAIKTSEKSFKWAVDLFLDQAQSGNTDALLMLAKAWHAVGDSEKARNYIMSALNRGHTEMDGSNALSALADLEINEGRPHMAIQIRRYGLEIDGSPASEWGVSIDE
ncbi:hypothetical protein [Nonomuraea sp. B19D2]|uniref:tetratricopeptide repeat protein n=1 Tax=Nonomuraea sp. B19D2 TaxID=3159561 RepID=UPI0032DA7D59